MINSLANLLTVLSLFCGFFSITFALTRVHYTYAAWAIILSVVFDGLDGQVARLNPVPSEFGKQLDSLIDVVSFGVAPALLGYVFIYERFHLWAVLVLFFYLLCSVWRLAKYNLAPKESMHYHFWGLPTTVSGGLLASFILIYRRKGEMFFPGFMPDILMADNLRILFLVLAFILAVLMVSRVKFLNLDGIKKLPGRNIGLTIGVLSVLMAVAAFRKDAGIAIFTLFLVYLLFSPLAVEELER